MLKKIPATLAVSLATTAFLIGGPGTAAHADYFVDQVGLALYDPQAQDKCFEVVVLRFHYDEHGRLKQIDTVTYTQYKPIASCVV